MAASSYPLARERNLILAGLIVLAAAGWAVLLWQAAGAGGTAMGLTMGLSAPLFLATWIAMMFPTAAPMILTFARVSAGQRERGQAFVPTWVFVAAYLLVWTVFGALAYLVALGVERLAAPSMWLMDNGARLGG